MSAILRAHGHSFNPDAFLQHCPWPHVHRHHHGEPRTPPPKSLPGHHLASGIAVPLGNADLDQFPQQLQDALTFLHTQQGELQRLARFPGVEGIVLDFGIAFSEPSAHSVLLPAPLVHLAATCKIALQISHYPIPPTLTSEQA